MADEPKIIDTIDYEQTLADMKSDFKALSPSYTGFQESDVIMIIWQVIAALIIDVYTKINTAAKTVLVSFATGSFLDYLGVYWDVTRRVLVPEDLTTTPPTPQQLESDESYRSRILAAIKAFTRGATPEYYEFYAKEADPLVQSARVYELEPNTNKVYIAIKTTNNNGVPTTPLLNKINSYLNSRSKRSVNDVVIASSAVGGTLNVTAQLVLLPDAPSTTLDDVETSFITAFNSINELGRDITLSWIIAQLNSNKYVYKVILTLPTQDLIVDPNEFVSLGTITLTEAEQRAF